MEAIIYLKYYNLCKSILNFDAGLVFIQFIRTYKYLMIPTLRHCYGEYLLTFPNTFVFIYYSSWTFASHSLSLLLIRIRCVWLVFSMSTSSMQSTITDFHEWGGALYVILVMVVYLVVLLLLLFLLLF